MFKGRTLHFYSITAEGVRALGGALLFVIAAPVLGPERFGTWSLIIAAAILSAPLLTFGSANWIQPYVQSTGDVGGTISHLLLFAVGGGTALASILAPAVASILNLSQTTLWLALVAEVGLYSAWGTGNLVLLASGRGHAYLASVAGLSLSRVAALLIAATLPYDAFDVLAVSLTLLGFVGTVALAWATGRRFGFTMSATRANWRQGLSYAAVSTTSGAIDQIDRIVTLGTLGSRTFGIYSAASRIIGYALVPARGISQVQYPKYFRMVNSGDRVVLRRMIVRTAILTSAITIIAGGLIYALLSFIGETLLADYPGIALIAVLLLPRYIVKPAVYAAGDALYALGRPRARVASMVFVAIAYGLGLVLMPRSWGVAGVIGCGLIAEIVLLGCLVGFLRRELRRGHSVSAALESPR